MPLEIRELVIRTTIETEPRPAATAAAADLQQLKKEVVRECLERLAAQHRKKTER